MKAYVMTTGVLFGLITLAHVWRVFEEGRGLAADPSFILLTIAAAALCLWALATDPALDAGVIRHAFRPASPLRGVTTDVIPQDPAYEAKVRESFGRQGHMTTLGAAIEFLAPGEVHLSLPFAARFCQQNGFMHAGAIASIADSANGYAASR